MTGVSVFWILLINAISVVSAYVVGRSNWIASRKLVKPKAVFCGLLYADELRTRKCNQIYHECKSGLCDDHCSRQRCGCLKRLAATTEEKEILAETRRALKGA